MNTAVSVIIPTFNRRHTLQVALESVAAQTHTAHQIIVVDDGSTDGTSDWLQTAWPNIDVLRQDNRGVSAARNLGIAKAEGDWIALLDSDDAWMPEKLEKQITALQADSTFRLCHTDELWFRNGVRVNPKHRHKKYGGHIFKQCLPLCAISPSAALISRSAFSDFGLFDESLPACEDYDFWLRFCAREPVLFIDEALVIKTGGHEDQLSRAHPAMDRFRIQALLNILENSRLSSDDHDAALTTLDQKLNIYGAGAQKRGNTDLLESFRQRRLRLKEFTAT